MLKSSQIDPDALMSALTKLKEAIPNKAQEWFDTCCLRLTDIKSIGKNKQGFDQYQVLKNPTLDKGSRFSYRKVIIGGRNDSYRFCSCFFVTREFKKHFTTCTHIGACLLWRLYHRMLNLKYRISIGVS